MRHRNYTVSFSLPNSVVKTRGFRARYVAKFEERYGRSPDTFDALSYDATHLIFQAIEEAGNEMTLKQFANQWKIFSLKESARTFQYDEYQNAVETAPMLHYIDGEVAEVFEVDGN